MDGEVDAIILNERYLPILGADGRAIRKFDDYTRNPQQFDFNQGGSPRWYPNESITVEPFVVYCSGIDARNSRCQHPSLRDVKHFGWW